MNTETNYAEHFYADISNDIDTLKKNVNENPFSSVAQFMLLYSYKKNNDPSFEQYARQAAIYFNNIPWIQYQLSGVGTDPFSQVILPPETHQEVTTGEQIIQNPNQEFATRNEEKKETVGIADNIQTLGVDEIQESISTADEHAYRSGRPIIKNPNQHSEMENEETKEASNISDKIQTLGDDETKETKFTADEPAYRSGRPINQNPNQESETENEETKEASNISDKIQTLGDDEIKETKFTADEPAYRSGRPINQNPNQESETENEETKETVGIADNIQTLVVDEIQEKDFTANEPDHRSGRQITENPNQEPETGKEEKKETAGIADNIQTLGVDEIRETSSTADEPTYRSGRPIIENPNQESETENEETKEIVGIADNIQTLGVDEIQETSSTADEPDYRSGRPINQNPNQEPETGNEEKKETAGIADNIQTLGVDEIRETSSTADEPAYRSGSPIIENPNQESENEEKFVAFEPLHTVDYFASQGIKISEEALENDHLGQQVKSFTAWLKSMKKLHPGQLPEQNEVIEKIIQSSAEASNQNANVLTEAMAEVLIKQGKKEKAIEMYQKLSLMNPSKSTYFAAKIESLKTI